jgi:chaperonin GroEL
VQEAGDGTTTATVLAHAILHEASKKDASIREIKEGINDAVNQVIEYLEDKAIKVSGNIIDQVATISTNNDEKLGKIIGEAFKAVNETGVVIMEPTTNNETSVEVVDGVQYSKGLVNDHFITSKEKRIAELENPWVLIIESPVNTIRQIQSVLEFVIKNNKPLLIIGDLEPQVVSALAMNKVKGNIKINVVNAPTYGINKKDTLNDLSILTGATVINEELGDDLSIIQQEHLGQCIKSTTNDNETIIQVDTSNSEVESLVEEVKKQLEEAGSPGEIVQLEKRLARLSARS